ncbi:MAG TPA: tetraacyldisaccharide 4'-kinase [Gammaproteobacteria bacterium]|nr:tetraacyldisaccharide 4'-kinase [Gammaproteobacteria bacterium]
MNPEIGRPGTERGLESRLERIWYENPPLARFLAPLGWLYGCGMVLRRLFYRAGVLPARRVRVPVIVVGNITVGGTGKTPLVIWLCELLQARGHRPGVISRGYGGLETRKPQQVRPDSDPSIVGDEPLLISRRTGVPVAIAVDRYTAARQLLEHTDCDILICDDGLQHLGLDRDLEIAVVDGERLFGNRRCLPAGPLREFVGRLDSVDMVVVNGGNAGRFHLMELEPCDLRAVGDPRRCLPANSLAGQSAHAVAGIGNPGRFFRQLRLLGINPVRHEFPDHHPFQPEELDFNDDLPVVMTEKDAVKCQRFACANWWYLPVTARLAQSFIHRLTVLLKEITDG